MDKIKLISAMLFTVLTVTACNDNSEKRMLLEVDSEGITNINFNLLSSQLNVIPLGDLSNAEAQSIIFMREEEKLARDVYTELYKSYLDSIFINIAASEQTHTDAVSSLIIRYKLNDPMAVDVDGEFENSELQIIYDSLIASGAISLLEGLYVGARVEELDIYDIERLTKIIVDNSDIVLIYNNLLKGSRNHLRSFNKQITLIGGYYTPIYISQTEYNSIVNFPIERN
jgi:hypothetical protein